MEPSIYKLTARASSQFATHSPYAHAHVVYWSSYEPGAPSAHAPTAHWPSREPYPRDITGAAEGPSAREQYKERNVAKHCAIIACRNNLDYRVSKISLMWVRVGDGILGMERKQKSLNGAI